ncbi:MAG: hypothetical protein ACRENT_09120, partial [Thermodesulfobacteriota bacterium]
QNLTKPHKQKLTITPCKLRVFYTFQVLRETLFFALVMRRSGVQIPTSAPIVIPSNVTILTAKW